MDLYIGLLKFVQFLPKAAKIKRGLYSQVQSFLYSQYKVFRT
jgi:hypothetical protein